MGKRIPQSDAEKLCQNWTGSNQPNNAKSPGKAIKGAGFKDTYETWFSVEELETYLEYVKQNISDNPGIRIYFGNYGKNVGPGNNASTIFLAPTSGGGGSTEFDGSEIENDYNTEPYNSGGNKIPPIAYDPNP